MCFSASICLAVLCQGLSGIILHAVGSRDAMDRNLINVFHCSIHLEGKLGVCLISDPAQVPGSDFRLTCG